MAVRRRIGHLHGISLALGALARVELAAGDFATAHRYLDENLTLPLFGIGADVDASLGLGPGLGPKAARETRVLLVRGAIAVGAGDAVAGAAAFRRVLVAAGQLRGEGWWAATPEWLLHAGLAGLSWVAAARGDPQRAARLGGSAARVVSAEAPITRIWWGFVERWLEPARRAVTEGHGAAAWEAGRALPLAVAVEEALALADETETDASAAVPAPSPAAPRAGAPAGLSAREREVAVLVARGRTNPQIARELVIAPRTASRHVENVMAKLGVHSRAEIGAWAARQDLMGPDVD